MPLMRQEETRSLDFLAEKSSDCGSSPTNLGGVLTPKKTKKNQKKPKKTKPIYQFWCSDWFFLGFFGFFWFFLVFFGFFWDDILTLNLNSKKSQKKPKKTKKNQRSPKNQFPISNVGQGLCQKKPKKAKKNQKKPKKTSFQFRILAKTNAKKNQKKPKKTKKNQCQFGNLKKPKKTKKNQKKPMPIYRFWCSDWFFLGEHPPNLKETSVYSHVYTFFSFLEEM